MSTSIGDSSSVAHASTPMSKSSSSDSNTTTSTSLVEAPHLKGLEGIEIHPYVGITNMQKMVQFQSGQLEEGKSNQQYLAFNRVTETILAKIDDDRSGIGKATRLNHFTDTDLLIIKLMPSLAHEQAQYVLISKWLTM
jgi:hypothetical protein